MISAIIPLKNEAGRATILLQNLALLPIDHIILILNGCCDATAYETISLKMPNLHFFYFRESLGIDIPRAIGAKAALALGSDAALFIDGDMIGTFNKNLLELIDAVTVKKIDLALTDCYPTPVRNIGRCNPAFRWRLKLNQELSLDQKINIASPSHGPHAVSKKFLTTVPMHEIAIPPVALAIAKRQRLQIGIGTTIPHAYLGSAAKDARHTARIIDTIVGDCIEAIAANKGEARSRCWQGKLYLGYHQERRFDILDEFLTKI